MANVAHSTLTDPNIHEPKGVAAATANKVYVSDGAASGSWKYPGCHVYGGIYSKDASIAQSTIGTTAAKLAAFDTNGPSNQTTCSAANDQITVTNAGVYMVCFNISYAISAAGDAGTYQFHLRVNGSENTSIGCRHYNGATTDIDTVGFAGLVTLAANDIVTVYVESDEAGNTDDIVIHSASLDLVLLKVS